MPSLALSLNPALTSALTSALPRSAPSIVELDAGVAALDDLGVAHVTHLLATSHSRLRRSLLHPSLPPSANLNFTLTLTFTPTTTHPRLVLPGSGALRSETRVVPFARALASNQRLDSLALGCACIDAAGAVCIANALEANPPLRSLELQHNPLLDSGAAALGSAPHLYLIITSYNYPLLALALFSTLIHPHLHLHPHLGALWRRTATFAC